MGIQQMLMSSGVHVQWIPAVVHDSRPSGPAFPVNASILVTAAGQVVTSNSTSGSVVQYDWLLGGATASQFSIYATLTSGTSPSGSALNSWLALSSNQSWSLYYSVNGSWISNLSVQLRHNPTGQIWTTNFAISAQKGDPI